MKMTANLADMAAALNVSMISFKSLHGIRWLASQTRAVRALLLNYKALCSFLETVALGKVGCDLTTLSPSSDFIGRRVRFAKQFPMTLIVARLRF